MNRKGFAPILLLLIVVGVLIVGGGVRYWKSAQPQQSISRQQAPIYTDKENGVVINFPLGWVIGAESTSGYGLFYNPNIANENRLKQSLNGSIEFTVLTGGKMSLQTYVNIPNSNEKTPSPSPVYKEIAGYPAALQKIDLVDSPLVPDKEIFITRAIIQQADRGHILLISERSSQATNPLLDKDFEYIINHLQIYPISTSSLANTILATTTEQCTRSACWGHAGCNYYTCNNGTSTYTKFVN